MPLCGFNKNMLEGLAALHKGLVEHGLIERAKIKGEIVEETLERELIDMERFLGETKGFTDSEVREITEALTKYAQAFYRLVKRKGLKNYEKTVRALGNFYETMDRKFYEGLEGKSDNMKQLIDYLNTIKL